MKVQLIHYVVNCCIIFDLFNQVQLKKYIAMDRLEMDGKWNRVKGAVRQKYGEWFDDDKAFAEGKFEEMLGKMQEKSGRTREDIEREIRDWDERSI